MTENGPVLNRGLSYKSPPQGTFLIGRMITDLTDLGLSSPASCCYCCQVILTLCSLMDYNPSGSSVHGISQTRIPEWVSISCSRGSSRPRDQTHVSCIGRQIP